MPKSCELNEKCNNNVGNPQTPSSCQDGAADYFDLSDIFYTNQRKGRVFRVLLNGTGFKLQNESPAGIKEQLVHMRDIVGGRCMRMQKQRRLFSCSCRKTTTKATPVEIINNEDITINTNNNNRSTITTNTPCANGSHSNSKYNSCTNAESVRLDESAYLYVFAYILKKRRRNSWRRERTVLTLRFRSFDTYDENLREAERWYYALHWHKRKQCAQPIPVPMSCHEIKQSSQLLVLLNPKSGAGNARKLFMKYVTPVLNEAEFPYQLKITQHAYYARDFVRNCDIDAFTRDGGIAGIVAVGGDGLFFEILNGILQRSDWQKVLQNIPLGIVPCGSGNGLARSIANLYNEPFLPKPVLGAALTMISRKSVPMDVVQIQLENEIIYSCLSVGWGLISDIDIESEILRPLGYQRFTLWTLHRLVSLRTYQGKISYHLKEGFQSMEISTPQHNISTSLLQQSQSYNNFNSNGCLSYNIDDNDDTRTIYAEIISLETSPCNPSNVSRCNSWWSVESHKSAYFSVSGSLYQSIFNNSSISASATPTARAQYNQHLRHNNAQTYIGPQTKEPPLQSAIPNNWLVEEGEFIMVHAAYQTHLGVDCLFAPQAKLNDGIIYLVIIRSGISRTQLFNFLINMSKGTHLPELTKDSTILTDSSSGDNNNYIKVVPVTAFRIEPLDAQGIITVDGECVPFGALQAEILPGIARIMVPQ